ncbi:hypothetical protein [Streptomyces sp. NPDC059455]|uniref:hypothetical protein n=1 Tax=Streptomyces sp. NPDC059455 TaxID=3346837 RepID=UPI003676F4B7
MTETLPESDAERSGPPIGPGEIQRLTRKAVSRADTRQWSIDELAWATLRPEKLTDTDRSVVRFITFIEDHIPGYLTYFLDAFPVSGRDLAIEEFCFNREYFRFLISWANEEERHASVLTRYQIEADISDPETLMRELAEEGRKKFALPYENPVSGQGRGAALRLLQRTHRRLHQAARARGDDTGPQGRAVHLSYAPCGHAERILAVVTEHRGRHVLRPHRGI